MALQWETTSPEQLLEARFRITRGFHPGQRIIIEHLVKGKRILAIQRTGWGKSLCYQMASLYYPHLTIVFSPLKALIRDQCQRCNDIYHIPAAIVSSDFDAAENIAVLEQAVAGQIKILFIAPERLGNVDWQNHVVRMRISMVVVDEAHCISTWGHDFRPHYRRIIDILNAIPKNTPVLALTATANQRVEEDILQQIGADAIVIRGSMKRPNLRLNVIFTTGDREKLGYLAALIPQLSGTGIIYCATQEKAEMVATFLRQQLIAAECYHSRRAAEKKQEIERRLMANEYKVVCSTNALGMGIDKPDIRFIIHYHFPASPIHYYQEIGRAGRDDNLAYCILLYDAADRDIQEYFARNAKPAGRYYEMVLQTIRQAPDGLREKEILLQTKVSSQTAARTILADLIEQQLIEKDRRSGGYLSLGSGQIDFSAYDRVLEQKLHELQDVQNYASVKNCYMDYLASYLGDEPGYHCGVCGCCVQQGFPFIQVSERIVSEVMLFLEEKYLPHIDKGGERNLGYEAGWSLSYHADTRIGALVSASKYRNGGPFAQELVERAVKVIRERYPIQLINGVVSVPPTRSGNLVEAFARRVADVLGIEYMPALEKIRLTKEQKDFVNRAQKAPNVKDAFLVARPSKITERNLLLIDDIYDSGHTMKAVTKALRKAGVRAVYPFTITRTMHSDDQ